MASGRPGPGARREPPGSSADELATACNSAPPLGACRAACGARRGVACALRVCPNAGWSTTPCRSHLRPARAGRRRQQSTAGDSNGIMPMIHAIFMPMVPAESPQWRQAGASCDYSNTTVPVPYPVPRLWTERHKTLPPVLRLNGPFCALNGPVRKCPFRQTQAPRDTSLGFRDRG